MHHLDERTIGLYAIHSDAIIDRAAIEAHFAVCAECRETLQEVRSFEALLREPEAWPEQALSAASELRSFAARAATEDATAIELLEEFSDSSEETAARFVWAGITLKAEYQNGGVARLLCKLANRMCEQNPLYALKLAEAATLISDNLPDTAYPRRAIYELRGEARKEQANALRFLGRLPAAARAIADAEAMYDKSPGRGIGHVAVTYVRGVIQYEQEDPAAERSAEDAAEAALHLGLVDRYMSARYLVGLIMLDRREFDRAADIFVSILTYGKQQRDLLWIARASQIVGVCYLEAGRTSEASPYLHEALRIFTELDFGPEITRTYWSIGRLMFAEGNVSQAVSRLRTTISEFTNFEMLTDAALVALDLAEILGATRRAHEIPKVLATVVKTFTAAGKLTSALAALAYLKESAASSGTVSKPLVAYVRRYVRRAEREPDRLFVPPPPGAV